MNGPVIHSFQDALLFVLPALGILLLSMFHLDELMISPRHGNGGRRPMCGVDANGEPILTDPDGRLVPSRSCRPSQVRKSSPCRSITPYRQSK